MFDIGFFELLVIGVIALLVLGPERLPKAARSVGLAIGKVKRSFSNVQEEFERQMRTEELKEKLKDPYATFMDDIEKEVNSDNKVIDAPTPDDAYSDPILDADSKDK